MEDMAGKSGSLGRGAVDRETQQVRARMRIPALPAVADSMRHQNTLLSACAVEAAALQSYVNPFLQGQKSWGEIIQADTSFLLCWFSL